MFNAVSLVFSFVPPRPLCPPLSICGNSLSFGIDPPLAANERELCFLGLETGLLGFWTPGFLLHFSSIVTGWTAVAIGAIFCVFC